MSWILYACGNDVYMIFKDLNLFFVNYCSGQFRLHVGAIEEGPTPEVLMALGVEAEPL